MITLDQCTVAAVKNRGGQWVGVCKQFPDIKTPPRARKIDAIDLAIDAVRDRIRDIEDKRSGTGPAPKTKEGQR